MTKNKMGRPTDSIKNYTLRVRLCKEELSMLDFLCNLEGNKNRSALIRNLLIKQFDILDDDTGSNV